MVTEIALLSIHPGQHVEFERAVAAAAPLFKNSPGCLSMQLAREIENPSRYRLFVEWQTVEHHMETFRGSDAFQQWRALAGPFFAAPPEVVHSAPATQYF